MKYYYIFTYGCQMNKSDSERIISVLENMGYKKSPNEKKANLILVNMCSVRQSAVDRVYGLSQKLSKLKIKNKRLKTVLTGCILEEDKKKFNKRFDLILDIKDLKNWQNFLSSNPYKNPRKLAIEKKWENYFDIKPKQQSQIAFVPISNGCNNFCSYCVVPYVRGSLVCRNYQEILEEVKDAAKKGFKEIWLLGQNVNDYQNKVKSKKSKVKIEIQGSKVINFAKLVQMIDKISGDFKFFFTSPHPKNFSDKLIKTLATCEKFGKLLNLPVQSGNNKILRKMNRNYTIEEYKELVQKIREEIPDIKLSTDVIVGFPGETKKQFEDTVKLFKEIKFDYAYIAKYSPRPGTTAFKMKDDIPFEEKKRREKILREIIAKN